MTQLQLPILKAYKDHNINQVIVLSLNYRLQ